LRADGYIDLEAAEKLAIEHKPKLIWVGATAYSREFPFEAFAKIADKVGAYLVADIAHIS
jgi:glycine hydroxymethyltransferase